MTRSPVLALLLAACGGPQSKPAPIENTAPPARPSPPPDEAAEGPGSARVIMRSRTQGVIALVGDRSTAMTAATREMEGHCGKGAYLIHQEGEELDNTAPGGARIEWRVHYLCDLNAVPPSP